MAATQDLIQRLFSLFTDLTIDSFSKSIALGSKLTPPPKNHFVAMVLTLLGCTI